MQQTCPAPKTPCQLTLQPPSWLVIESALGPVTTSLALAARGSRLFWLRSNVMDSRAAFSVASRPALTAALALLSSTYGWSNRPSWNFSRRMRRTDWSMRATDTEWLATSWARPACQPAKSDGVIDTSTPALTALAIAPAKSGATWYALARAPTSP